MYSLKDIDRLFNQGNRNVSITVSQNSTPNFPTTTSIPVGDVGPNAVTQHSLTNYDLIRDKGSISEFSLMNFAIQDVEPVVEDTTAYWTYCTKIDTSKPCAKAVIVPLTFGFVEDGIFKNYSINMPAQKVMENYDSTDPIWRELVVNYCELPSGYQYSNWATFTYDCAYSLAQDSLCVISGLSIEGGFNFPASDGPEEFETGFPYSFSEENFALSYKEIICDGILSTMQEYAGTSIECDVKWIYNYENNVTVSGQIDASNPCASLPTDVISAYQALQNSNFTEKSCLALSEKYPNIKFRQGRYTRLCGNHLVPLDRIYGVGTDGVTVDSWSLDGLDDKLDNYRSKYSEHISKYSPYVSPASGNVQSTVYDRVYGTGTFPSFEIKDSQQIVDTAYEAVRIINREADYRKIDEIYSDINEMFNNSVIEVHTNYNVNTLVSQLYDQQEFTDVWDAIPDEEKCFNYENLVFGVPEIPD